MEPESTDIVWNNWTYKDLKQKMEEVYNKMVYFRRNLFKIPTSKAGKDFIEELVFWLRQFNSTTKLSGIALKVYMVLPTLLLQKPSARSKAKDHSSALALGRRLKSWQRESWMNS